MSGHDSQIIVGGPPPINNNLSQDFIPHQEEWNVPNTSRNTHCSESTTEFYNQMQSAVDCICGSDTLTGGSLCRATALGNLAVQEPFSCMIDLLTGEFSNCGAVIPPEKRQAALQAFTSVTGLRPVDLVKSFDVLNNNMKTMLSFNAFYIFMPILLLSIIVIWLMVGFGWITWVVGLFATALVIIVLYGFALLYRIHTENWLNSQSDVLQRDLQEAQINYQNSVAYFPQGLYAIACAITAATGTTGWTCNTPPTEEVEASHLTDETIEEILPLRKRFSEPRDTSLSTHRKRNRNNNRK